MLRRSILRRSDGSVALRGNARLPLVFTCGQMYHGFVFKSHKEFPELNLTAFEFEHHTTKARYFHFDSPDTNNTFCIGFGTPAQNSKGTTHVLEHTVLCGSRRYPVKDPFFHMLRRSLSTFMNAMTGPDYTLYPFATTNQRDFENLLDVYSDAVFSPLLRAEDFRQEGHRLEIPETDTTTPTDAKHRHVKINGVVFNEMRGVVSEPSTHFSHKLMETMLPSTHYAHVSGGYPTDILDLTHEELVAFHQDHYHPSNSITVTYGDLAPGRHMEKLNTVFSTFKQTARKDIPFLTDANRRHAPNVAVLEGPLDPMGDANEQHRVGVSFACKNEQSTLDDMVRLVVLDALLTSGPSSPMYKALLESKLGSRYCPMSGYSYYLSTPIVTYGVEGVSGSLENREEKVQQAVLETLKDVSVSGFDKRRVASVVFQEEMQQKHRTANYGIGLCTTLCAFGVVRPSINPTDFVNWLPHLKNIERNYEKELLPLIGQTFLQNQHRTVLSVKPTESCLQELQSKIDAKEADWNAKLTAEQKEAIAVETEKWRERIRQPQDSSCLPTLTVADIPTIGFKEPEAVLYDGKRGARNGDVYTIPYATNGLVYVHGIAPFPPHVLKAILSGDTASLDPFFGAYHGLLGQTGAGSMDYKELSIETELVCGGFRFSPLIANRSTHLRDFTAGTNFAFYTTQEKLPKALELLRTIVTKPRLDASDADVRSRVQTMTMARCSSAVQGIQRSGNAYAMKSAAATLSTPSAVRELWSGLSQCTACSGLLNDMRGDASKSATRLDAVIKGYADLAQNLPMSLSNSVMWATCEPKAQSEVAAALQSFIADVSASATSAEGSSHLISLSPLHIGQGSAVTTKEHPMPIDTSFVGLAIPNDIQSALDPRQQALRAAAQLLKNEYLHQVIREEGGAYGASAASTVNGDLGGVTLSSYRDPTPEKTVASLSRTASVLGDTAYVTQQRLDEAKLRLFSQLDSPVSADTFGQSEFLYGASNTLRQQAREMLLNVSCADVVSAATLFAVTPNSVFAIVKPEPAKAAPEQPSSQ